MDFAGLQNAANGQFDSSDKTYRFDPAPFNSQSLNALLTDVVKQQSWQLTGVTGLNSDAATQTITFQGQCSSFYGQANAALKMILWLDSGSNVQLTVELSLPAGWTFTSTFPQLQGTVFDDVGIAPGSGPLYVFASAAASDPALQNGAFAQGMNFYGTIVPSGPAFGQAGVLLGAIAQTTAVGPIAVTTLGPNMTLTLGLEYTLSHYFPVLGNAVQIQLVSSFQPGTQVNPPTDSVNHDDPSRTEMMSLMSLRALGDDPEVGVLARVGLWVGTSFDFGANKGLQIGVLLTPLTLRVVYLEADFEGIMLPTPQEAAQDFLNLIGGNDLYTSLPSDYQSSSHLALKNIKLAIGMKTLRPESVSLLIGTPAGDPGWSLGDVARVTDVELMVKVSSPFVSATRSIVVVVNGTTEIATSNPNQPVVMDASASAVFATGKPSVWEIRAGLADGSTLTIPIGDWIDQYLPTAIDVPNVTLDSLGMAFVFQSPQNHYSLYAGLDPNHPLSFKFGGETILTILYADFAIDNFSNNGSWGGSIDGSIQIFSVETVFVYQMPGDFKITAAIPQFEIDLPQLVTGLVGAGWTAPTWLPTITFPETDLFIARQVSGQNSNYTFALRAQPSFGVIVLQVVYQSNTWAFAAALQLDVPKIAAFDGLSSLSGMDDLFSVDELLFVFASADMAGGFQFPPTASFPGATGKSIAVPNWAGPVKAGFYFFGQMSLNTGKSKNLELVQQMFQLSADLTFDLLVYLSLNPSQNAYAQASMTGQINEVTTITGVIGARMEAGEPQFYVAGMVSTSIQGSSSTQKLVSCNQPNMNDCLTAALVFELTENAAFLAVSMIGSVSFGPVTLSNMVLVVGIDFEGIPSLGFAGQIDLSIYDTTYDSSIAFFFDSGDPAKSLIAGSISDVTLKQIADTIVGVVTDGDKPPAWLDDLLAQVGVSGTQTFYLPLSASTALDSRDLTTITQAFNTATSSNQFSFSNQTTLLVVGATDLEKPGVWYITDFPSGDVIHHYELYEDQANNRIRVSLEAQFYYCMPPGGGSVVLGPPTRGLTFNSGIFVNGTISFFMLKLAVTILIEQNKGVYADLLVVDPIRLIPGLIELTGNLDTTHGPHFSMSTYTVQTTDPDTHQPVTLPAHFYLDGKVIFLGLTIATTINVDKTGLLFVFDASIGDNSLGANFSVNAAIDGVTDFSFGFSAGVHINDPKFELFSVELGTIPISLNIACGLTFGVKNDAAFLTVADCTFQVGSIGFTIPAFTLSLGTDTLSDLPGIIYDAVKALVWDFLRDVENWLLWIGEGIIEGVEDIEKVLDDIYNAIASVWANEKRIVVAVHESFAASQATTITIIPAQPVGGVTQQMIDDAHTWAEQTAEWVVTQAIVAQIKQIPPEDIGNFQVNSVQNIDQTYNLQQTVNWYVAAQGGVPTLTSLGYQNPVADQRFFTRTQSAHRFQVTISTDADFNQTVQRVVVAVQYNGANLGSYTFTSNLPHTFTAPWDAQAGDAFQMQYTVAFRNPGITPINSAWLKMRGDQITIPVQAPVPVSVTLDGSQLPFDRIQSAEVSNLSFMVGGQSVPSAQAAQPISLTRDQQRVTVLSVEAFTPGASFSYTYQLYFTYAGPTLSGEMGAVITGSTPVSVVQPPEEKTEQGTS